MTRRGAPGRPGAQDLTAAPRYVPDRPLPARGYLPGRRGGARASQTIDAGDAEIAEIGEVGAAWCARWRSFPPYLWGVDLYNHGYGWEAHEVWEPLWRAAPRGSPARLFLQGLIQCAAAQVQARAGRPSGARRLAVRGTDKLERAALLAGGPRYLGVDAPAFAAAVRAWAGGLADGEGTDWPWLVLAG